MKLQISWPRIEGVSLVDRKDPLFTDILTYSMSEGRFMGRELCLYVR